MSRFFPCASCVSVVVFLLSAFSILERIEKPRMPAGERDHPALDEHILDVRPWLENAAVGYDDIRILAHVERTHSGGQA